jgi:hypothetical protein
LNTGELLLLAAKTGVTFWLDGDRLAYRAPKGRMSQELKEQVVRNREQLIRILQQRRLYLAQPISQGPAPEHSPAPLSTGQERLWLIERGTGPSPLYNINLRLLWRGALDRDVLARCIQDLVTRHAVLRTTFTECDGSPQAIISPDTFIDLAHLDLRQHDHQESEAHSFILAHQQAPFDLNHGPLIRSAVITLADDDHIVLLTQHHLIFDGWSISIFVTELGRLYAARLAGRDAAFPELALQYTDYVCWEREWRHSQSYQDYMTWWKEHLDGLPPLTLGRQQHAQPGANDHTGATYEFCVPATLAGQARQLARDQRVTLYTVLLSAWAILLYRHAKQTDFAIGTGTRGRYRMEFHDLCGFFANTLVLRCDLSGNPTAAEAIARFRDETQAVFEHEAPFADVVMATGAAQGISLNPLIQAAFMLQNIPIALDSDDESSIGATVTMAGRSDGSVEGTTKFDIGLTMRDLDGAMMGCIEYAVARFTQAAIRRMGERFIILLQSVVANPHETVGKLRIISEQERQKIIGEWSRQ